MRKVKDHSVIIVALVDLHLRKYMRVSLAGAAAFQKATRASKGKNHPKAAW